MNPETENIKSKSYIERRFRFFNALGVSNVAASLIGIIYLAQLIYQHVDETNFRIIAVLPIVHFGLFLLRFLFLYKAGLKELTNIQTGKIGQFKTARVKDLFKVLIRENFSKKEELPSVFILRGFGANAFAINSLLLNFSKRLNCITIGEELFSILSLNEIKAIALHEIGHFKKNINFGFRIQFIPMLFILLGSYVLTALIAPSIYTYIIFFFLIRALWMLPYRFFNHDIEYLSDLYAAERCGKLSTINGLIKIHRIEDIDITINRQISERVLKSDYLNLNDIEPLKQKVLKKAGKKVHDPVRIDTAIETVLSKEVKGTRVSLPKSSRKKRDKALNLYLKNLRKILSNKTLNWSEIDHHIRDGNIDEEEYAGLIQSIKENPELPLFKSPNDNIRKMKLKSHPALRQRILFLDKNCSRLT